MPSCFISYGASFCHYTDASVLGWVQTWQQAFMSGFWDDPDNFTGQTCSIGCGC